jgi:hypothetical protein
MFSRLSQVFRMAAPLRYHLVRFVDQRLNFLPLRNEARLQQH